MYLNEKQLSNRNRKNQSDLALQVQGWCGYIAQGRIVLTRGGQSILIRTKTLIIPHMEYIKDDSSAITRDRDYEAAEVRSCWD